MQIKKGQIVAVSDGEYSDYQVRDYFRALRDFTTEEAAEQFMQSDQYKTVPDWDPKGDPESYKSDDRFMAWAMREGYWEPLPTGEVIEWWIGAYSQFEPSHKNHRQTGE